MKAHRTLQACLTLFAMTLATLGTVSQATADDLTPPPWPRLGAANYTTAQEWEFKQPTTSPYAPDGDEVPTIQGDGLGGQGPEMLPDSGVTWDVGDGDGAYVGNAGALGTLNFRIPNWIDKEPVKYMQVQITYEAFDPTSYPSVIDIIPFDPTGFDSFAQLSASNSVTPDGRSYRLEMWEIRPNPDFESVIIGVPGGVSVDQVVIDTISTVPEPATMSLLAMGGLALVRRRYKRTVK